MNDLPDGWAAATIADVTLPFDTIDPKKTPNVAFRYVDIGCIDNTNQTIREAKQFFGKDAPSRARRVIRSGDTLFSTVRTYLKNIALVSDEYNGDLTSTGIALLRPAKGINSDYLFRWACSQHFIEEISQAQDGTMYPAVTDADVASSFIPLPPSAEQERLVKKLDDLFTRTGMARTELGRIPLLIEHYRAAILSQAFACGGSSLNTSSLGQIVDFVTSGSRGWAKYYSDAGPKFIRVGNIQRDSIELDLQEIQHVSPPSGAEGERTRVRPGDIVITITADLGRVGLIPSDIGEAYVNQHVALVRLKDATLAEFVAWFLLSSEGQTQLLERNRGMTRAGLGLDDIRDVQIPLLSEGESKSTVTKIRRGLQWLNRVQQEWASSVRLLDHLDRAILSKAFRGELVPQDHDDEPASALLERIKAEKSKDGKASRRRDSKKHQTKTQTSAVA